MKCFHSKVQQVDESVTSIKELDSPGGEGCLPPLCPTAWSLCPEGRQSNSGNRICWSVVTCSNVLIVYTGYCYMVLLYYI